MSELSSLQQKLTNSVCSLCLNSVTLNMLWLEQPGAKVCRNLLRTQELNLNRRNQGLHLVPVGKSLVLKFPKQKFKNFLVWTITVAIAWIVDISCSLLTLKTKLGFINAKLFYTAYQ